MSLELDTLDKKILSLLQDSLPLVEQPYAVIAEQVQTSEQDVLARVSKMKCALIRQTSAIFDSASLGYKSCLVAAKIAEDDVADAVRVINAHPGVSHNYRRNHDYNIWFTLAVPPDSQLGLEATLDVLQQHSKAQAMRMLPTLKMFKIGVKFDLGEDRDIFSRAKPGVLSSAEHVAPKLPTPEERKIIRVLQQDLPVESHPFAKWSDQAGVDVQTLLQRAKAFLADGRMRRFSAVIRHRQAGFGANAMGVWPVPPEKQEKFGQIAASFSAVSHCYLRPTYEDWPYSIFTMVHAPTAAECEAVLQEIGRATETSAYSSLYSTEEFKKIRVKYFTGDIERWETRQLMCTTA